MPAKFKVPRNVFIEADLPRTPIGKVAKPVLRERVSSPTARTT
jgi:non-ribosomal peptide synthetase component E (peptide arylation enzyme)